MPDKKQIVSKKTYLFELTTDNEGMTELTRTNNGFNAIELLGLISQAQIEIIEHIKGESKPDIIKRIVVDPE